MREIKTSEVADFARACGIVRLEMLDVFGGVEGMKEGGVLKAGAAFSAAELIPSSSGYIFAPAYTIISGVVPAAKRVKYFGFAQEKVARTAAYYLQRGDRLSRESACDAKEQYPGAALLLSRGSTDPTGTLTLHGISGWPSLVDEAGSVILGVHREIIGVGEAMDLLVDNPHRELASTVLAQLGYQT